MRSPWRSSRQHHPRLASLQGRSRGGLGYPCCGRRKLGKDAEKRDLLISAHAVQAAPDQPTARRDFGQPRAVQLLAAAPADRAQAIDVAEGIKETHGAIFTVGQIAAAAVCPISAG